MLRKPTVLAATSIGGRVFAIAALVVVAAVVVIIVASNAGSSKPTSAAGTTATGATTVQRRNLVATDTESGTLSYDDPQTVFNRLTGTITWVPRVGRVIKSGQTLFTVDNRPVLLMDGSTPAYRDLTASDDPGPDVYELNRALVNLGYNPDGIVIDDTWQPATTAGVQELQYHLGQPQTGTLTLGQIVFLPGPQMIQTVDTTVGSTGGGGSDASYTPGSSNAEFVSYSKNSDPTTDGVSDASTDTATDTTTDTTTTDTTTSRHDNQCDRYDHHRRRGHTPANQDRHNTLERHDPEQNDSAEDDPPEDDPPQVHRHDQRCCTADADPDSASADRRAQGGDQGREQAICGRDAQPVIELSRVELRFVQAKVVVRQQLDQRRGCKQRQRGQRGRSAGHVLDQAGRHSRPRRKPPIRGIDR